MNRPNTMPRHEAFKTASAFVIALALAVPLTFYVIFPAVGVLMFEVLIPAMSKVLG